MPDLEGASRDARNETMATPQRRLSAILHGVNGTSVDAGREVQHVAAAFGRREAQDR